MGSMRRVRIRRMTVGRCGGAGSSWSVGQTGAGGLGQHRTGARVAMERG